MAAGDDELLVDDRVVPAPELPWRAGVFRGLDQHRIHACGVPPIQIPEIARVAHEQQRPIGQPAGLQNRFTGAACNDGFLGKLPVLQLRVNQLSAVPRHIRVIPHDVDQFVAAG